MWSCGRHTRTRACNSPHWIHRGYALTPTLLTELKMLVSDIHDIIWHVHVCWNTDIQQILSKARNVQMYILSQTNKNQRKVRLWTWDKQHACFRLLANCILWTLQSVYHFQTRIQHTIYTENAMLKFWRAFQYLSRNSGQSSKILKRTRTVLTHKRRIH